MPKVKYISFLTGAWVVRVKGVYLGRYRNLALAIKARNEYLENHYGS